MSEKQPLRLLEHHKPIVDRLVERARINGWTAETVVTWYIESTLNWLNNPCVRMPYSVNQPEWYHSMKLGLVEAVSKAMNDTPIQVFSDKDPHGDIICRGCAARFISQKQGGCINIPRPNETFKEIALSELHELRMSYMASLQSPAKLDDD